MSHWAPDYGFEQFQKHRGLIAAAQGTNEATTRLRAIDTMLFEVLGWNRLDVDTESYCRAIGYADYGLKCESVVRTILEAKKDETEFLIADAEFPTGACGFALLASECPAADKALRQAMSYANEKGAQYSSITNGHQWLITLTFVHNQPVEERRVIVFESLDALANNPGKFRLFWDCFSPAGVCANRSHSLLVETRKAPPPNKLSQRIAVYPVPATRRLKLLIGTSR